MFHVQSPEQLETKPNGSTSCMPRWRDHIGPPADIDACTQLTMQRPCHFKTPARLAAAAVLIGAFAPVCGAPPAHDFPTQARVEYVNDCMARHGGQLSQVYQCSCVIDRIADTLSYDDFVEAGTFAKYSSLAGEAAGIFRDSDEAKSKAKMYRELEARSLRECGLTPKT